MAFNVAFSKQAVDKLNKMDYATSILLLSWIKKNLQNCYNPRSIGYQLEKFNYNYWKYRIGDYRILSLIEKDRVVILSVETK